MPTLLKDLRVNEISSVDRGAGEGVQIMLMKRDIGTDPADEDRAWAAWYRKTAIGEAGAAASARAAEAFLKRDFSADDRKRLAASGAALPDGSFPIETRADLENAVHAYGRASDKAKAKAHIISRAKSLGCTDCLPDDWKVAKGIGGHISVAANALLASVASIFQDKATVDKAAALTETFGQFEEHLQDVVPAELSKAVEAEIALKLAKECDMTEEEKKAKEKADKEAAEKKDHEDTKKALDVLKRENAILKMSDKHKQFMSDSKMSDDEKDKFAAKSADERDAHMEKNPVEKALPASVQKALDEAAADRVILKQLQENAVIADFKKRATDLGLQESQGEILRKAYSGDKEAIGKLEALLKGLAEQVRTGKVFEEFGKAGGGNGAVSAYDQLVAKAAEYREGQITIGKKCTPEMAFAKVYTDPANAELKKVHDADEVNKRARFAA